jgi:hypothetical protein
MTTQAELDEDLLIALNTHLISRRDLLKRVKAELNQLGRSVDSWEQPTILHEDVMDTMDRLIAEAAMPGGTSGN